MGMMDPKQRIAQLGAEYANRYLTDPVDGIDALNALVMARGIAREAMVLAQRQTTTLEDGATRRCYIADVESLAAFLGATQ